MIAKLSDELALELDRSGDRPLSVEHPQTHKRYVIVSADEYAPARQPLARQAGPRLDRGKERPAFRTHRQGNRGPTHARRVWRNCRFCNARWTTFCSASLPCPWTAVRALHEQLVRQTLGGPT